MASGKTKKNEIIIKLDKKVFDRVFKVTDFFLLIFFLIISPFCFKNLFISNSENSLFLIII